MGRSESPSRYPLPSREGNSETLSPGGRGKGEGAFRSRSQAPAWECLSSGLQPGHLRVFPSERLRGGGASRYAFPA